MTRLNIFDAKTHLSRYLRRVQNGETILLCRNNQPIAQIIPIKHEKKRLRMGALRNKILSVSDDFNAPLTEREFPGIGL